MVASLAMLASSSCTFWQQESKPPQKKAEPSASKPSDGRVDSVAMCYDMAGVRCKWLNACHVDVKTRLKNLCCAASQCTLHSTCKAMARL